jgi:sulfite reductase (NADPH) hemoprotein beta-component
MTTELSHQEHIKQDSNFLRGTIAQGLADPVTGAISDDDNKLLKFHGSYQQDDRDLRDERRKQRLEPAYSFMIRARLPGGLVTPAQWLAFDAIARDHATRGLRITTRQTFQWHGVIKGHLKPALQAIDKAMATTIAACGDVNRQVVTSVNPYLSAVHSQIHAWAKAISDHFLPKTRAYHEIWLDGEKITAEPDEEPIYGPSYLPRKFKIGLAVPPVNDCDVFAQDAGLIAIIENNQLAGFNVTIGGGMGATHGDTTTYPRLGSVVGFIAPENVIAVLEGIMTLQRDYGNRSERRYARLKYTIDRQGVDWFVQKLQERTGVQLEPARAWHFQHSGDQYGWIQGDDGMWHLGLAIESGRLWDDTRQNRQTGLREIALIHQGVFLLTCNQNLVIANVSPEQKQHIEDRVRQFDLNDYPTQSGIRRNSVACVALPTCGLAMAESERYLPELLPKLEALLESHGLINEPIVFRLSGCPNGCSRPYLGEIALIGRAPGRYDLRAGAEFNGQRLNEVIRENVTEKDILASLDQLFKAFAAERIDAEHFGNFLVRTGKVRPNLPGIIIHRHDPASAAPLSQP